MFPTAMIQIIGDFGEATIIKLVQELNDNGSQNYNVMAALIPRKAPGVCLALAT